MHAHELRFCAQAYLLKIFFNAWYNAAQLRKATDNCVLLSAQGVRCSFGEG